VVVLRSSAVIQIERAIALRNEGVPVINDPDAQRAASDKWRQALLFRRAGVPHPRSLAELDFSGSPPTTSVVRKPRRGSSGVGVELRDLAWAREHEDEHVVFQEQVFGPEFRVVVVGNRCVGWAAKVPRAGEFRGNLAQGASMHDAPCPSGAAAQSAASAVRALGLDYGGVDLIMTIDGPSILEVNAAPTLWGPSRDATEEILGAMVALLGSAAQPR
jgi:ribosomal protein S6--L-glutamate ligase